MKRSIFVLLFLLGQALFLGSVQAACLMGKVYLDSNGNQQQDASEKGVADVRLFTSSGLLIITDQEGRYSYCGRDSRTMVVKLDALSLKNICAQRGFEKRSVASQVVPADDVAMGRDFFSDSEKLQLGGGLGRADFGLRCQ
jgi:hypothetical protein